MEIGQTLHEVIRGWAARTPDAPALLAPGRSALSYAALARLMDATHTRLRSLGLGSGARVAVVLPDGPEMAAVFCAVAGAVACAPMNPASTADDFEFSLTDMRASAIVVDRSGAAMAADVAERLGISVLGLGQVGEHAGEFSLDTKGESHGPVVDMARPAREDVALLLHTSGTTARPKLVPLRHRNLCASARNIGASLELRPEDRCLNVMPFFHIHGLMASLVASLAAGASVVCTPGFQAARFMDWLAEFQPTWYSAVPTLHQAILAHAARAGVRPPARLRFVRSSSAALAPAVMKDLEKLFSAPVIEAYGMTEASHQMASNPLPPATQKPGSVGRPAGPEIAVMDESGAWLSPGQSGEVVIRGENVTAGYEGAPEADQSAFTDGWFRTGDLGYLDAEGYLFLTGRLKEIINRGGEKISPYEVENVLLEHPSVREAVAFAVPDGRLGEELGAAVSLKDGSALDPRRLREYAGERLTAFKVPAVIRVVADIPKGPTGKPRRIGLAATLGIHSMTSVDQPAVGDSRHEVGMGALRPLWCELLGLTDIGDDDDFFAAGGTSLQAAELGVRAEMATGRRFDLLDFARRPTLRGLATILERERPGHSREPIPRGLLPIQSEGDGPALLCIPSHLAVFRSFVEVAGRLGPDFRVFGVDLIAAVREVGHDFVPLAERIAILWNEYHPVGPVFLLGHCLGGRLAYEVACRLSEGGREVAYTGLVHAYNERYGRKLRRWKRGVWKAWNRIQWARYHWHRANSRAAESGISLPVHLGRQLGRRFAHAPADRTADEEMEQMPGQEIRRDWRPRPYSGRVVLYRNRIPRPPGRDSRQMGWDGLVRADTPVLVMPEQFRNFSGRKNVSFVAESARQYMSL